MQAAAATLAYHYYACHSGLTCVSTNPERRIGAKAQISTSDPADPCPSAAHLDRGHGECNFLSAWASCFHVHHEHRVVCRAAPVRFLRTDCTQREIVMATITLLGDYYAGRMGSSRGSIHAGRIIRTQSGDTHRDHWLLHPASLIHLRECKVGQHEASPCFHLVLSRKACTRSKYWHSGTGQKVRHHWAPSRSSWLSLHTRQVRSFPSQFLRRQRW